MEELWPERDLWEPTPQCRSRLAAARKHRGVNQERMAQAVGLALATYRRLENLEMKNPPLLYLVNCALVLDVPLSSLIEDEWSTWNQLSEHGPPRMPDRRDLFRPRHGRPDLPPA